jgi:hypothetical protein
VHRTDDGLHLGKLAAVPGRRKQNTMGRTKAVHRSLVIRQMIEVLSVSLIMDYQRFIDKSAQFGHEL